jgi:VCBS repeat protein/flagellar hook capping protein FlgD
MIPRSLQLAPLFALALFIGSSLPAAAVTFVDSGASLLGAAGSNVRGATAWGDFDGDGDLDLVVAGSTDGNASGNRTRLYRNDGGSFVIVPTALPNLGNAAFAWGDYDGDGDLDLAVEGVDSTSVRVTRVYRNDGGGAFVDIGAGLTAVASGGLAWGDFDGDGDLDLAACGTTNAFPSGASAKVYRNDGGTFVSASSGIVAGGHIGAVAFGDVDGDGDLDLVVTGYNTAAIPTTSLYRNDAGSWVAVASGLAGVAQGAALAFGDADGDGDLDLAILGSTTSAISNGTVRIYSNDGTGSFADLGAVLAGLSSGSAGWGDFDGDGDLDLLAAGDDIGGGRLTYVARNDGGGVFTQVAIAVTSVGQAAVAWGDYDHDGRLDIALAGISATNRIAKIYRNTDAPVNAAPGTPGGLSAAIAPATAGHASVTFSWTAPTDDHTPQNSLSYELRIGTTPGGAQVTGAAADGATGLRRVARLGSTGGRESWTLVLPYGVYYWSVQAVDGGLRGSAFAAEQSVTLDAFVDIGAPLLGVAGSAVRCAMAWGDYDGDGDLDLVVAGSSDGTVILNRTRLYRNDGGSFVVVPTALPNLGNPAFAWGDYDGDGDLDLAVEGVDATSVRMTRIYRNGGGGAFVDIGAGLTAVASGGLAWGDFDGDGDLDLAASGSTNGAPSGASAKIYRNDGGTFVNASSGIAAGGYFGAVAFGDVDGDGDLDLVVTGYNTAGTPTTSLYRNDAGSWVAVASGLAGVAQGAALAFGDADGDGDLDLAILGSTTSSNSNGTVKIYSNDGTGSFTNLGAVLGGLSTGSEGWGDFDGDGDLDLLAAGDDIGGGHLTYVARNDGGGAFTQVAIAVTSVGQAAVAWGDYDHDGRLDIALAGISATNTRVAKIYRNIEAPVNTPPAAPGGLNAYSSGTHKVLRWDPASDAQTPAGGLSYDVRIGTTTRGGQIVSLPADSVSGLRRLPQRGVAQADSFVITLPDGVFYYTVQAVDAGFAGSALPAWHTMPGGTVGVEEPRDAASVALAIRSVSPNPVVRTARVGFDLPHESDVELSVFDVAGRRVSTILRARMAEGRQLAAWDGRGASGASLPAGVYLLRLSAAGRTDTRGVVIAH